MENRTDFISLGDYEEEDDGDKDEERREHVRVVRNEVDVVFENNLSPRELVLEEVIHLFRHVKDNGDREDKHDREEERA